MNGTGAASSSLCKCSFVILKKVLILMVNLIHKFRAEARNYDFYAILV